MIRDLLSWLLDQFGWDWLAIWLAAVLLLMLWPAKKRQRVDCESSETGSVVPERGACRGWRDQKSRFRMLVVVLAGSLVFWFAADRWREYRKFERWKTEDAAERQNAPEWKYQLSDFRVGDDRRDIEARFRKGGFHLRCFQGHGILPQDASMCWFNVKPTQEVPVESVSVFFNAEGKLNAVRLALVRDRYDQMASWLGRSGKKLEAGFGMDGLSGKPVEAWIFDDGLAMASGSPDKMDALMVYWMTRPIIVQNIVSGNLVNGPPGLIPLVREKLNEDAAKEILSYWNKAPAVQSK